jgi:hypothetical protein
MTKQEDFFSPKHHRLLNIAYWANILAWIALIAAFIFPLARFLEMQSLYDAQRFYTDQQASYIEYVRSHLTFALSLFVDIFYKFVFGFIYFIVLKGVSYGLNMLVETDINYREQKLEAGTNEE